MNIKIYTKTAALWSIQQICCLMCKSSSVSLYTTDAMGCRHFYRALVYKLKYRYEQHTLGSVIIKYSNMAKHQKLFL
jgi:hypothetical protein